MRPAGASVLVDVTGESGLTLTHKYLASAHFSLNEKGTRARGTAHERIAKDSPPGSDAAVSEFRRAQESYLKARDVLGGLERQGKLTPQMKSDLQEVNRHLEQVSAELSRIQS
jgi:hypothetical protein